MTPSTSYTPPKSPNLYINI